MRQTLSSKLKVVDVVLAPLVYPAGFLLRLVRRIGTEHLPRCKNALLRVGVFPIRDHYHEPQFDMRDLKRSSSEERPLPGIDWNLDEQRALLDRMTWAPELANTATTETSDLSFYFGNPAFGPGDAEYWYQIIRLMKPARIYEIGSGHSTRMARAAISKNAADDPSYRCDHVCIEPYEFPWLDELGVTVVRSKLEDVALETFSVLEDGDILFIDSSHVIRPEGDVLAEFLQILPSLKPGVVVHVHDIFSPRNYPTHWLTDHVRFWNEQYLLEAFLTHNSSWKIIGSLNYLHHREYARLQRVCPFLTPERAPGSFYLRRR